MEFFKFLFNLSNFFFIHVQKKFFLNDCYNISYFSFRHSGRSKSTGPSQPVRYVIFLNKTFKPNELKNR